jgi:hypothetical protein
MIDTLLASKDDGFGRWCRGSRIKGKGPVGIGRKCSIILEEDDECFPTLVSTKTQNEQLYQSEKTNPISRAHPPLNPQNPLPHDHQREAKRDATRSRPFETYLETIRSTSSRKAGIAKRVEDIILVPTETKGDRTCRTRVQGRLLLSIQVLYTV